MLIYNEQIAELDRLLDELIKEIKLSEHFKHLIVARQNFLADNTLQAEIKAFEMVRNQFNQQEKYAKYRPEIKQLKIDLIQQKRALDFKQRSIDLKLAENDLQASLDEVIAQITTCFSEKIQIKSSHPLNHLTKGGHHGKCHLN